MQTHQKSSEAFLYTKGFYYTHKRHCCKASSLNYHVIIFVIQQTSHETIQYKYIT